MATPFHFPQANKVLGAPAGQEENVQAIHVYTDGKQCVSVWKLDAEELAEVARTGEVRVNVLYGGTMPPVYVWVGALAQGLF